MLNYKNIITPKDKEVYDSVTDTAYPMSFSDMQRLEQEKEAQAENNKVSSMLMSLFK